MLVEVLIEKPKYAVLLGSVNSILYVKKEALEKTHTHTHTYISLIRPIDDSLEENWPVASSHIQHHCSCTPHRHLVLTVARVPEGVVKVCSGRLLQLGGGGGCGRVAVEGR